MAVMDHQGSKSLWGTYPDPAIPIGLPGLAQAAFDGVDLAGVWNALVSRVTQNPNDAAAFLDLSIIANLQGRPADSLALQSQALQYRRIYTRPSSTNSSNSLRLLAFMAPGDFMANLPIEFLVAGADITLHMLYGLPGCQPTQPPVPDHDVAIVAVAESDDNQPVLADLGEMLRGWHRPIINRPEHIARLSRDGTWQLLNGAQGLVMPINVRVGRAQLDELAGATGRDLPLLDGGGFPILVRPVGSHAGEGLAKIDEPSLIGSYLLGRPELEFYLTAFVDYRSADGFFRKYRVVLIEGRAYASHMAISSNWMVHYLNAGMLDSGTKRREEASFMADFDSDFAARHAAAFSQIARRTGMDFLPFDCGETREGDLLIFETGTNMIVHSMDDPDLFPYKMASMQKLFGAFRAMCQSRAEQV